MRNSRRTIINLVCSIFSMMANIVIGFFLSPFIIKNIGVEANGFVSLANNFVMYANLLVTALNSMAGRFITIEYVKKDYKKANLYYNSVFWGNLIIVAVLVLPSSILVGQLDAFINIPTSIVAEVKLLFLFIFLNFFMQTAAPNWECGAFITNRLDRTYIPNMFLSILRCILLISMMKLLIPKVWYVGLVSCIIMTLYLFIGWINTHYLTPHLQIHLRKREWLCSWAAIKQLVGAGIWNSISSIGGILLNGIDLLICNLFIGSTEMGILALAKILPSYMQNFSTAIFNAFAPELIINYAKGDKKKLLHDLNRAMKIMSVLLVVPLSGIIIMSGDFFRLWVPSQNTELLSKLTIIICAGYSCTSGVQILNSVFSTVNKVRTNALLIILSGIISTIAVFLLLKTTTLGIYAVAGVSVVVSLIRNQIYTIPYAAKYLGLKWNQFYSQELLSLICTVISLFVGGIIHNLFVVRNWFEFVGLALIIGVILLVLSISIFLNKEEKQILLDKVRNKIRRRKSL